MTAGTHAFALYRSGWHTDADGKAVFPWPDNQLWASIPHVVLPAGVNTRFILQPEFGSFASLYQVDLTPAESAEPGWAAWEARLVIDNLMMGTVPLAWYVGNPSDWPSGVVRFPEVCGPRFFPTHTFPEGPRGVWTLAARRNR